MAFNLLRTNPTKWSNTLKQFVGKLPTNCLSVFNHFVKLVLKRSRTHIYISAEMKTFEQLSTKKYRTSLRTLGYSFKLKLQGVFELF